VDALLLGHSPWPDLAFAEGSYAQLAADAGLALRTEVDGTQNILPTFEGLALRVRAAPQGLAALPPVDRAAAALGLMLLEGRLRLLVLGFERLPR